MSRLVEALDDYLSLRQAMGYKLMRATSLLPGFVSFVECHGSSVVTVLLARKWACLPAGTSSYWWAKRLCFVRGFAKYLHGLDPRHEIPSADLIPYQRQRATPYLYSTDDIERLLQACTRLPHPLMVSTYQTLFGLLYVTGMRVGEAIALDRDDVDEDDGVLTILSGKFGKSRELVLHNTTVSALARHAHSRDASLKRRRKSPSFFLSKAGTRLHSQNVWRTFARLRVWAEFPTHPRPPRIHDLRHSFAVRTILGWYRDGVDVESRIATLSTYLGHVKPSMTYWYLTAAPELMQHAATRLETALGDIR